MSGPESQRAAHEVRPRAREKTQLAMQVVEELNETGTVRRKTQLALDDAARSAELPVGNDISGQNQPK
jgi:hypothetical protein